MTENTNENAENVKKNEIVRCAGLMVPRWIADLAWAKWPHRLPMQSHSYFYGVCNNHVLLVSRENGYMEPENAPRR